MIISLHAQPVNPAPSLLDRWQSYKLGCALFAARQPFDACTDAEARRGWLNSLNAEAVAQLPVNSADRLGF